MNIQKITKYGITVFVVAVSAVLLGTITRSLLSWWMGFNLILAIIPLFIIDVTNDYLKQRQYKFNILSIIALLTFVFFFPNTLYMITDFIHIESSDFYHVVTIPTENYYMWAQTETIYHQDIASYVLLVQIFLSSFAAICCGLKSLCIFEDIVRFKVRKKHIKQIVMVSLMFLSSVGIYIGRFLRFFSWDILNPWKLLTEFLGSLNMFALWFILLFTFTHIALYHGYKFIIKTK